MPKVEEKKMSPFVKNFIAETEKLEARWLTCSFDTLDSDISQMTARANKDEKSKYIYDGWAEIAKAIYNRRIEELTGLNGVDWSEVVG